MQAGKSAFRAMLDVTQGFDAAAYLSDAGVAAADLAALRSRLLGPE